MNCPFFLASLISSTASSQLLSSLCRLDTNLTFSQGTFASLVGIVTVAASSIALAQSELDTLLVWSSVINAFACAAVSFISPEVVRNL